MATPARQQYLDLKAQHPDAVLWFRMGDFYELFDDDARVVARELNLTLTSREFGRGERVPMAGVPHHAAHSYLARLVRKGYRVAIAEQMTPPGHGIVERAVTRVVSAGTVVEPNMLSARANNYLAAVMCGPAGRGGSTPDAFGLAYVDVTTGEFAVAELTGDEAAAQLPAELARLGPAECLVPWDQAGALNLPGNVTRFDAWRFEAEAARARLLEQLAVRTLDGFGCSDLPLAVGAAGAILAYLAETNPALLPLLRELRTTNVGDYMQIDAHTRRNLELTHGARGGSAASSLLEVLDLTRTPMGGRLLRRFLGRPLLDLDAILERQAMVAALHAATIVREQVLARLGGIGDLERLTSRSLQGVASARDLLNLRELLQTVEPLRDLVDSQPALAALRAQLDPCADVADEIGRAVASSDDGRLIRDGFDAERDALVAAIADTRCWLAELESAERARTGIKSLKVGYNQVFGYYIEVTHPHRDRVPADYLRKQTLTNCERYITPALKEAEARILHAEERIGAAERALFQKLLARVGGEAPRLLRTASALAHLDVYAALAEVAERQGYVRPELHTGDELDIEAGRHPVVEAALGVERFVANDCQLGDENGRIALLTGPNMAGKSTYLRQVALIVLLAQIGSFVPARRARIGLVDRVFTRIGAQDDLAAGASTFMVEMVETAAILRHATRRSLVVLDEIGRGTSTQDGLAIARAVIEHLHERVGARALFATHYHELTALAEVLPGLRNYHTLVREECGEVVFLHRVVPGGADRSYGLHVARLAGLPGDVLARAQTLLAADLSEPPSAPARPRRLARIREADAPWQPSGSSPAASAEAEASENGNGVEHVAASSPLARLALAAPERHSAAGPRPAHGPDSADLAARAVLDALCALDLCNMTPLDALNTLARLQQLGRDTHGR